MPTIGLRGSFTMLALVLSAAALLIAWKRQKRFAAVLALAVSSLLAVVSATGGDGWRLVLSSGAFRWRETELTPLTVREIRARDRLVFYQDAADATVSVEENGPANARELMLRVNGKTDASTRGDLAAQYLITHLPMMAKPDSKDVFVFGMGSGISAGAVLGYPIDRLTVAENCEPVLRAANCFAPWNNGVLTNARTHILHEDARTVLKLSPQKYDVIVAEPSNPWTVGIGSVFSREFYQIATNRLKPGGIMAQWCQIYDMNDDIVELIVRTFGSVFPVMEVWEADGGDLIMLGSDRPWKSDEQAIRRVFELEGPRRDLSNIGLLTPQMVMARQFASQRTGHAIAGPGSIQSDDFPVLEYQAPKAMYIGRAAWRLFRYDERTWQADLASPEKNNSLAALSPAALRTIFAFYHSANPDVQSYVARFVDNPDTTFEPLGGGLTVPCVFGATNTAGLRPPPGVARDETIRRLFDAEIALRTDALNHPKALEEILDVLDTTQSYREQTSGWSATYYASLAAKLSLRHNNPVYTRRVLLRGLQLEPDSEVLQYLARVLVREGLVLPLESEIANSEGLRVRAKERTP
jgi:spermidine synthase